MIFDSELKAINDYKLIIIDLEGYYKEINLRELTEE